MSACIEQTTHETHVLLLPLDAYVLIYCCVCDLGTCSLNLAKARRGSCAVIFVAAITHLMQPTACQCFSAQSYITQKQLDINSGQAPDSTAEAVDAILQDPISSTDKEDYPVCFKHYFDHYSEHLDANMLLLLLLCTVSHAHWDPNVRSG